jgi:hypothetical protein
MVTGVFVMDMATNSYTVSFLFDHTLITTTVFVMHEDAAPDIAAESIMDDLGVSAELLDRAQDISVLLVDTGVGMDDAVLTGGE